MAVERDEDDGRGKRWSFDDGRGKRWSSDDGRGKRWSSDDGRSMSDRRQCFWSPHRVQSAVEELLFLFVPPPKVIRASVPKLLLDDVFSASSSSASVSAPSPFGAAPASGSAPLFGSSSSLFSAPSSAAGSSSPLFATSSSATTTDISCCGFDDWDKHNCCSSSGWCSQVTI
ncbi:uncharacterized protein LOC111209808 [Brassica napus]|uniref:uncharacterized protein LOC106317172 n=1 Tax=Brassica oleracea var. oleracea TaxID=109376 RepID=UPI0006A7394E|nr:PREDICTED: uncharacterized protein LOC106317172 [Brassica oleracea var. oleracea]XP_022565528.1 uncharacterized protein LOC111209808 [Brassica napus]